MQYRKDKYGNDISILGFGCMRFTQKAGMIDLDKGSVRLTINIRYPVTYDDEQVYEGIMEVINPFDLGLIKSRTQPPIYFPAEDPLVTTLMGIYRKHTGDEASQPLVIGGGTYARAMDGIVAFGARFPGKPELGHQKNEKIAIDDLMLLARIYADAILQLAGEAQPAETAEESVEEAQPAETTEEPEKESGEKTGQPLQETPELADTAPTAED